jgi:hypothetical protein
MGKGQGARGRRGFWVLSFGFWVEERLSCGNGQGGMGKGQGASGNIKSKRRTWVTP